MLTKSCKAKARRLQDAVVSDILTSFPQLCSEDVRAAIMGQQGVDVILSKKAKEILPLAIECKAVEHLNLSKAMIQASYNCPVTQYAVVVHRKSREAALVTLAWADLLELILCNYAEIMTWKERAQRAEARVSE